MRKRTRSKAEKLQEEMKRVFRLRRISQLITDKDKIEKEGRIMRSVARKITKKRVHKPKPVRRPKNRVTIISIGGVNVEDENDYKRL